LDARWNVAAWSNATSRMPGADGLIRAVEKHHVEVALRGSGALLRLRLILASRVLAGQQSTGEHLVAVR
jgi:hypothetical protein